MVICLKPKVRLASGRGMYWASSASRLAIQGSSDSRLIQHSLRPRPRGTSKNKPQSRRVFNFLWEHVPQHFTKRPRPVSQDRHCP